MTILLTIVYLPRCSSAVENIKVVGHTNYVDTNNAAALTQIVKGKSDVTIGDTLYFNSEKNIKGCPTVQRCSYAHKRKV